MSHFTYSEQRSKDTHAAVSLTLSALQSRKGNLPDLHTQLQTVHGCVCVCLIYSSACITLRHMSLKFLLLAKMVLPAFLHFFVALLRQFVVAAATVVAIVVAAAVFCALLFNDTCAHIWQLIRIHLPHLCMTVCLCVCVSWLCT